MPRDEFEVHQISREEYERLKERERRGEFALSLLSTITEFVTIGTNRFTEKGERLAGISARLSDYETIAGNPHALPHYYRLRTNTAPAKVILWMVAVSNGLVAVLYILVGITHFDENHEPTFVIGVLILVAWGGFWTWLAVTGIRRIDQLRAECFEAYGLSKPE